MSDGATRREYADALQVIVELAEARDAAEARVEALSEALRVIPPDRLDLLADWFDADDENKGGNRGGEVQKDLRRMARLARAVLACPPQQPQKAGE